MGDDETGGSVDANRRDDARALRPSFIARLFGTARGQEAAPERDDGAEARRAENIRAQDMLVNLRNMRTLTVNDVSVPRADIVAVAVDSTRDEVLRVFRESTWSRLPVYDETLDQPLGIVHLKDFALRYGFGATNGSFDLKQLLRPLLYVPPSMPIGVLLHKMQIARMHMALVIDEYGGVDGLVTIEDLLEQIVGDIADEHDEDEQDLLVREGENVVVAAARMDLEDFAETTGVNLRPPDKDEEVDTLGGLVFLLSGRVPARAEIVTHEDGHEFEVLDADARRIKRLRVRLKPNGAQTPLTEAAE